MITWIVALFGLAIAIWFRHIVGIKDGPYLYRRRVYGDGPIKCARVPYGRIPYKGRYGYRK